MKRIQVHYYGEIAEKTTKTVEEITLSELTTTGLKTYIKNTYGLTTAILKIAINKQLVTHNTTINKGDEIAILSPFSGG